MTKERDIVNALRYHIIYKHLREQKIWTVSELVAFSAAFVYPFIGNILFISEEITLESRKLKNRNLSERDKSEIRHIIEKLNNCVTLRVFIGRISHITNGVNTIDLHSLTKEDLIQYFLERCQNITLELCDELSNSFNFIIMNEEGIISFDNNRNDYCNNILRLVPTIAPTYGENQLPSFNEAIIEPANPIEQEEIDVQNPRNLNADIEVDNNAIMAIWNDIGLTYETIKNPHFWENKLNSERYRFLKERLYILFNNNRNAVNIYLNDYSCTTLVALYVAEWFKWERTIRQNGQGEDGENTDVFNTIAIANVAQKVCEKLNIKPYSVNNQNMWLYTLYTFGGFPLRCTNAFIGLCTAIYELKTGDEDAELIMDYIVDAFGSKNRTFHQSLTDRNGSLRKYVEYIWEHNTIPVDRAQEANDIQNLIDSWNQALAEGRSMAELNYSKFKLEWEAELYNGSLNLMLLLTFNPNIENNVDRSFITSRSLTTGDHRGLNLGRKFNLIVKNGDNELRRLTFFHGFDENGNEIYTNYQGYEKYVIASDIKEGFNYGVLHNNNQLGSIDFTQPIKIVIETNEVHVYQTINIDEQIKFRFDRLFNWNTSRTRGEIALFLPRVAAFEDTKGEIKPKLFGNSGWIKVTKPLDECRYNGQIIRNVVPYIDGQLIIEPTGEKVGEGIIYYLEDKYVLYQRDDICEKVFLLRNINDIRVSIAKDRLVRRVIVTSTDIIPQHEYTVEYLQYVNGDLCNVNIDAIKSGYCEIIVKLNNTRKTAIAKCCIVDANFNPRAVANDNLGAESFEQAFQQVEILQCNDGGKIVYNVYRGAGLYNRYTNRKIGNRGGVFKHLESYYYLNGTGTATHIYYQYKYEALRKVYNDIQAVNHNNGNSDIVKHLAEFDKSIRIAPFSNKIIETINYSYRIQLNKQENNLDGCLFYYCTFDDISIARPVEKRVVVQPNNRFVYLEFDRQNDRDGILFQSLKDIPDDETTTEYYFRPVFIPAIANDRPLTLQKKRNERIDSITEEFIKIFNGNYEDAIKAFILASEHKLYYTSFNSLCALTFFLPNQKGYNLSLPNILIKFYLAYLEYCNNNSMKPDYVSLYRLSDELLFDWWYIPRFEWEVFKQKSEQDINTLLSKRPTVLEAEEDAKLRVVDMFWGKLSNRIGIRNLHLGENTLKVANSIRSTARMHSNFFYLGQDNWNKRNTYDFSFRSLETLLQPNN